MWKNYWKINESPLPKISLKKPFLDIFDGAAAGI